MYSNRGFPIPKASICALLVAAVSVAASVSATDEFVLLPKTDYNPAKSPAPAIGAVTAVQLALDNDPLIHLAREQRRVSEGVVSQSEGSFDTILFFEPVFEHTSSALTADQLKSESFNKRELLRRLDLVFDAVADEIEEQLASGVFGPIPECQAGEIIIDFGTQRQKISCPSPGAIADINSLIDVASGLGEDEIADSIREGYRRQLEVLRTVARFIAFTGRELLRSLGAIPTIQDRTSLTLTLGLEKLYRNGIYFSPQVQIQGLRDNYRGKPLDPTFGGKGILNTYQSRVGFNLEIPLGKGRGEVSAGASVRAASSNLQASLESEAHTMTESALNALLSYWALVAAQERVAVLEQSVERERELIEFGEALVEADEIARADILFVRARLASTEGSLKTARQFLVQARLQFATTLGLDVETLEEAPLASDGFPPPPSAEQMARWQDDSLQNSAYDKRGDVKAAEHAQTAARILAEAAQADLKHKVNLGINAWYTSLFEDNQPMNTENLAESFWDTLHDSYLGPSALITLDFDLPFRNSLASGRFLESRSRERRSAIEAANLRRLISVQIEDQLGNIRDEILAIERHEEAITYHRESLESQTELFRFGEATAVNLVQTEEAQISELLQLVAARQRLATAVTRLRFELGQLIEYQITEQEVVVRAVHATLAESKVGTDAAPDAHAGG